MFSLKIIFLKYLYSQHQLFIIFCKNVEITTWLEKCPKNCVPLHLNIKIHKGWYQIPWLVFRYQHTLSSFNRVNWGFRNPWHQNILRKTMKCPKNYIPGHWSNCINSNLWSIVLVILGHFLMFVIEINMWNCLCVFNMFSFHQPGSSLTNS